MGSPVMVDGWSSWARHNQQHHAGPRGEPFRAGDQPWCEVCEDLAPVRQLTVFHHTDPDSARAIVSAQNLRADWQGRVYFTTAKTLPHRVPGIMPRGMGAVVCCTLPTSVLRLDRAFSDELCLWVHGEALRGVELSCEATMTPSALRGEDQ